MCRIFDTKYELSEVEKMREKEQAEILTQMEEWADKKLDEKFQTEKFKALGKEHDHVFQALAFLGEASEKLSIAHTILKRDAEVMTDENISEELSHLQRRLHEFKEYVRTGVMELLKDGWVLKLKDTTDGALYFDGEDFTAELNDALVIVDKEKYIEFIKKHEEKIFKAFGSGSDAICNAGYTNMMKNFEFVEVEYSI